MMRRRDFFAGGLAATSLLAMPRQAVAQNIVTGGGFVGGRGEGNVISGDADTAMNAVLNNCVVNGRGAAKGARAISTSFNGDGCGIYGDFEACELTGQYAGHGARMRKTSANGYAAGEHADIESSALRGLYAGHSCWGRYVTADGESAMLGAIVQRSSATGKNAGQFSQGEDLIMIGERVTTARIPGEEKPVSEIRIGEKKTPWIVKKHGFGKVGERVNLILSGDQMPTNAYEDFVDGGIYPFTVLGPDELGDVGNKYAASSPGRNVRVAINTCSPKGSTAIGRGSVISRDRQIVINGFDMDARESQAAEARAKLAEAEYVLRQRVNTLEFQMNAPLIDWKYWLGLR